MTDTAEAVSPIRNRTSDAHISYPSSWVLFSLIKLPSNCEAQTFENKCSFNGTAQRSTQRHHCPFCWTQQTPRQLPTLKVRVCKHKAFIEVLSLRGDFAASVLLTEEKS